MKWINIIKGFPFLLAVFFVQIQPIEAQLIRADSLAEIESKVEPIKERVRPFFLNAKWRYGFDPFSLLVGFRHFRFNIIHQYKPNLFINTNIIYGWNGLIPFRPLFNDQKTQEIRGNYGIELQLLKSNIKAKRKDIYWGIGPSFRVLNFKMHNSYFINEKAFRGITVFKEGQLNTIRLGLMPSAGIILTNKQFNVEIRGDLDIYQEFTNYKNLVEPLIFPNVLFEQKRFRTNRNEIRALFRLAVLVGIKQ